MITKPKFMRRKIKADEIYRALFKSLGRPNDKKNFLWGISDKYFYEATKEEILEVIEKDNTNTQIYVPDFGDCDNYAFELRAAFGRKGWPVGILYVDTPFGLHAVFFFYANKEISVIEPQTDKPFNQINQLIGVIMY